jgi:hypothetical protein
MRRGFLVMVAALAMCLPLGCTVTPATPTPVVLNTPSNQALATAAGTACIEVYVLAAKPTAQDVMLLGGILDLVSGNLTGYQTSGFPATLPGITAAIAKVYAVGTPQYTKAVAVAGMAVSGLNVLFSNHADWVVQGNAADQLVLAFIGGAKAALPAM